MNSADSVFIITETATHVIVKVAVHLSNMTVVLEKADLDFDAKLGAAIRIYSRTNFDVNYVA